MKPQDVALSDSLGNYHPGKHFETSYSTKEAQAALKHNSVLPYFRLDDPFCRRFLELASVPGEFEGLKLLFPFVREMSLLRFSRTKSKVAVWMQLAFMAGHDLGRGIPEGVEDVLPGFELREAVRRVGVLQQCSGEEHLTFAGLQRAYARIVEAQWAKVPDENLQEVLLEAVVKSLRTGFAAGTVCHADPLRCEFVWDIPERIGPGITDIVSRALVGACREAVGQPVVRLLEHPLVRLARELYPAQASERDSVLKFLSNRLGALGAKSENECPASELDLVDWIGAGINYGRGLLDENPAVIEAIFEDAGGKPLEDAISVVRKVVTEAGGTEPIRLLPRLKCWQQNIYGWSDPTFYGEDLARVAYFVDFAIWIPWVGSLHSKTDRYECAT